MLYDEPRCWPLNNIHDLCIMVDSLIQPNKRLGFASSKDAVELDGW